MSFKTKFVTVLRKADEVATEVNPLFGLAAPFLGKDAPKAVAVEGKVVGDIDTIMSIVANVELIKTSVPGMTGPQAAVAAAPQVAQVILQALTMGGKKPKDSTLFLTQCTAMAGLCNDIGENFE